MENIDFIWIISIAFVGSFGHCIGMCGGIVLAYSSSKLSPTASYIRQIASHLSYNLGRVSTYTLLGVIFGSMGAIVSFSPRSKGMLFLATGSLMILAGLSLLGHIKFLHSSSWSISQYSWYQKYFKSLLSSQSYSSFYRLGLLNGILPCGLVYSFAIMALSTHTPWGGAMVMATFGLSTIPALFFLGFITRLLQQGNLRATMMKLSALLVIIYGIFTLIKGYKFLRYPEEMKAMMDKMQNNDINATLNGKFNGMKCEVGKCG